MSAAAIRYHAISRTVALAILSSVITAAVAQVPPQQVPFNNACGTRFGVCYVGYQPVGSYCQCGADPGQILPPPRMSVACGTYRGVCQVPPGPIGSPCGCFGDPGQRIP
jgi:hypothetical protein